jgi:hypothetical protein
MQNVYRSFIVPIGKYWLTDPEYLLGKNFGDWLQYLTICNVADIAIAGGNHLEDTTKYTLNGHYEKIREDLAVLSFSTACGPGTYKDQRGQVYCTDSGLLGLVPYDYMPDAAIDDCGILAEFTEETLCFTKDGILTFGNNIIDTVSNCISLDGMEL